MGNEESQPGQEGTVGGAPTAGGGMPWAGATGGPRQAGGGGPLGGMMGAMPRMPSMPTIPGMASLRPQGPGPGEGSGGGAGGGVSSLLGFGGGSTTEQPPHTNQTPAQQQHIGQTVTGNTGGPNTAGITGPRFPGPSPSPRPTSQGTGTMSAAMGGPGSVTGTTAPPAVPDLDMSDLSAEERAKILSVMARAQEDGDASKIMSTQATPQHQQTVAVQQAQQQAILE